MRTMLWNPKNEVSVFLSGMWWCVTGWLLPDVSKQRSGIIFKGWNVHEEIIHRR